MSSDVRIAPSFVLQLCSPPGSSVLLCSRVFVFSLLTLFNVVRAEAITSVKQTRDRNAVLVSSLDSKIRLMDKGNGQLLQSYSGHVNVDYRIRSCLGLADSVVVSGSEDGGLYAWDLLEGSVIQKLDGAHGGKVVSAIAWNGVKKEWASAGADGK